MFSSEQQLSQHFPAHLIENGFFELVRPIRHGGTRNIEIVVSSGLEDRLLVS